MSKEMNTLVEAINELRSQGYIYDFSVRENVMSVKDSEKNFKPGDLIIEKVSRFEGDSNPDDMSVLYGIIASDGTKGIIIDAYGAYEDSGIGEFVKKIKMRAG